MRKLLRAALPGLFCVCACAAAEPVDFAREIKPILEQSCVQCHGPEKQKGALRLDSREALLKGGEGGASVAAGQPEESEILRRALLPEADEETMPPKGKVDRLTAAEMELLKRWIAEGASWPEGLIAVAKPRAGAMPVGPAPTPAEMAARAAIAKHGGRVRPLAAGLNWVRMSFPGVQELPEEAWGELGAMANLVELDLRGVKVAEEQLAKIAGLSNLAVLNLAETGIEDAALAYVLKLEKLSTLNLYGTSVNDAGLATLGGLKQLRRIYVAGTKVTSVGVARLKSVLPQVHVDAGGQFAELAKTVPAKATK